MDSAFLIRADDRNPSPGGVRLVLSGRVTVAHARDLHRAAVELVGREGDVTVDCTAAEYLDTSAVQLLIVLGRELARGGRSYGIVGMSASVREGFRLAGYPQ